MSAPVILSTPQLELARRQFAYSIDSMLDNGGDPVTNQMQKEAEENYSVFLRVLKTQYQKLNKSLIFLKKYINPQITADKLDTLNDQLQMLISGKMSAKSTIESFLTRNDLFIQDYERSIEFIEPSLYADNTVETISRINEFPEISAGIGNESIFVDVP